MSGHTEAGPAQPPPKTWIWHVFVTLNDTPVSRGSLGPHHRLGLDMQQTSTLCFWSETYVEKLQNMPACI